MLLAIKKAESQIDKHIAEGEQALSEEKEAIELWLVAREKEYLSCKQQLEQLIAETQGMAATLRARYQALLHEINTHFAEVRAELHHNKEKSIKGIRRKAVTSIAVMVGACALAYALAPVLSSAIGSATSLGANASHMATLEAILKGGIMGGINGAFAKENILKATLKGAGFAALGFAAFSFLGAGVFLDFAGFLGFALVLLDIVYVSFLLHEPIVQGKMRENSEQSYGFVCPHRIME